jgi:hypothetical protein
MLAEITSSDFPRLKLRCGGPISPPAGMKPVIW